MTQNMEKAPPKGVLGQLSFLEALAKQKKPGVQPQSRAQELKAKVEELKKQRDRLRAEIDVHQKLQKLRTSMENNEEEEVEMDEDSENAQLLRLMAKHTQLKDILLAHHLTGGYDVIKSNQGNSLCVSLATAYQGAILETYNVEISVRKTLRIARHDIPPFIPVESLAEETNMQENLRGFLDALGLRLNAFAARKQQLKLIKERLSSVEVLESNALCSLLVLMLTEPKHKVALLCSLDYSDHAMSLPTSVKIQCEERDLSGSPQWQESEALLRDTPAHEALQIMRRTGRIL
ncbi:centromere protein O [Eucyclogobius newberryi]|uniref:centromere protein O n=1 Tax=Eucyclogobius newberryi TaxID=166745 RepID=UPI003B5CDB65